MIFEKVKLGNKNIRLESNAYSLVLYEDTFKRKFFKDFENICGLKGDVDISNYLRFLWCFAKCADTDIEDFETFTKSLKLGEVYEIMPQILDLINKNLEVSRKPKKWIAMVLQKFTQHRRKS